MVFVIYLCNNAFKERKCTTKNISYIMQTHLKEKEKGIKKVVTIATASEDKKSERRKLVLWQISSLKDINY